MSNGGTRGIGGLVDGRRVCRWKRVAGEKIGTWRRIDHWLMPGFLPAGRLGPRAPGGGVSSRKWSSRWKSSPENFSGNRGGQMAMKDSRDEGGLARVRYDL